MKTQATFSELLQALFTERLMDQCNASPHTIADYRDTFRLILAFAQRHLKKIPTALSIADLDAPFLGRFLEYLEQERHNSPQSRNVRLAAIRSFFHYVALREPGLGAVAQRVLAIPSKRFVRISVDFLDRAETEALLAAPDQNTWSGRRDRTWLLVAVQTGLRVSELLGLCCQDVALSSGAHVRCLGKGRKRRCVPLRKDTVAVLRAWLKERNGQPTDVLFPNARGAALRRDGVEYLLAGTGRISCNSAYIGIYGTAATLTNRDNALFSITNTLTIGRNEGGIGHVYQEGGLVLAGSGTETGVDLYTAGSEYVLSGGTLLASYVGSTYTTSGGAFVFDGGTLRARGTSQRLLRPVGSMTINAGKTALIDTAGFYERAQAALTGAGGLTKLGAGTLTLEGINTYTGPTLVTSGAVLFAEAQTLGAVTVSDGATVGTDLDMPDRQAILTSLNLGSNSVLSFVLNASDTNPAPARLAASAAVLNGPAIVSVTSGAVLAPGIYPLLDFNTVSGNGSLTLGPLPCGMQAMLVTNGTLLELNVTQGDSAPIIATVPASQAVLQNRPVTFSVALTECAEFASYQWVFNATNYLPDATNATYTILQVQPADQGAYQVIVANEIGSVTSTPPAILTVNADAVPPVPLSATRPYGLSTNVIVVFNELLDATSAQSPANYSLSNATAGVNVGAPDAAVLLPDQRTVRLTFAGTLADNTLYKLRAAGVKDLALNTQSGASTVVILHGVLSPVGATRLVVMEAEEADEVTASAAFDGNQRSWEIAADRPGYSGWATLQCLPNYGHSGNPTSQGPVASFTVDFPASDTYPMAYYLWIRGAGATPEDDSCQATLDWLDILSLVLAPSMSQSLYQPNGGWGWVGNCSQGGYGRAQFVLTNSGLHKVSLLMREDGFYCDKLVLTTDSAYTPATVNNGLGPDTLTRGVYPGPIGFVPGTLLLSGGTFKMNVQTVAGLLNIIEWKNTLGDPSWTPLTSFTGDGSVQTVTDSNPPPDGRFYQARVVIP